MTYKIVPKTIANKLKQVLANLVCENQNVFVAEQFITENMLVASETMYHIS